MKVRKRLHKRLLKVAATSAVAIALGILLTTGAYADSARFPKLFEYATTAMGVDVIVPVPGTGTTKLLETPEVQLVSRETLFETYRLAVLTSNPEYKADIYDNFWEQMREGLLGFLSPRAEMIYIANDIDVVELKTVIVHEYVHWIQVIVYGKIMDLPDFERGLYQWLRENEAWEISDEYLQEQLDKEGWKEDGYDWSQ